MPRHKIRQDASQTRLGALLRTARAEAGLSQAAAAAKLLMDPGHLSRIERGRGTSRKTLVALASLYKKPLSYFGIEPEGLGTVPRGTPVGSAQAPSGGSPPLAPDRVRPDLPQSARVYLADLRGRLTRAGVDDAEIAGVDATLRAVASAGFYQTAGDIRRGIEAVAEGALIPELRQRGRRIAGKAGGVVIGAAHQAHPESEVLATDAPDGAAEPAPAAGAGRPPAGAPRRSHTRAAGE
jgi:transcriptional regulator with XRE-family HTH domain